MNKAKLDIAPAKLVGNDGRLEWLPKNPRQWSRVDLDKTAASIDQDPDFLEDRPLLAVPLDGGKYLVFAGNLRLAAIKERKLKSAPVVVYFPETEEDQATVKRRAMKDNGSFGSWDWDALANDWDDLPLADFGIPAWNPEGGEGLPAELDGLDLEPDDLADQDSTGDEGMQRVIISYTDEEVEQVCALLGIAKIDKVIYDIKELTD